MVDVHLLVFFWLIGPRIFAHAALTSFLTPQRGTGSLAWCICVEWIYQHASGGMTPSIIHTLRMSVAKSYSDLPFVFRKSFWVQIPPPTAWLTWAHPLTTQPRFRHWMGLWGATWSRPSSPQVRGPGGTHLNMELVRLSHTSTSSLTSALVFFQFDFYQFLHMIWESKECECAKLRASSGRKEGLAIKPPGFSPHLCCLFCVP